MIDLNKDTTVYDLMQLCNDFGAGSLKVILRDGNDKIIGACIVTSGESATREIMDAIEPIEDTWADCSTCKHNGTNAALDPCHSCLHAGDESPGYDPR